MNNSIVITGLGAIGDFGAGISDFRSSCEGKIPTKKVSDFDFDQYIDTSLIRRADDFSHFAVIAAKFALDDAKLNLNTFDRDRLGSVFFTSHGPLAYTCQYHKDIVLSSPAMASAILFSNSVVNAALGHITVVFKITGQTITVLSYAPVLQAFKRALELLKSNTLSACLVGGGDIYDDILTQAYKGCIDKPDKLQVRFGGSVFFMLESYQAAKERGANILAQISQVETICADCEKLQAVKSWAGVKDNPVYSYAFDDIDSRSRSDYMTANNVSKIDATSIFGQTFSAGEAFTVLKAVLDLKDHNEGIEIVVAGKSGYNGRMQLTM